MWCKIQRWRLEKGGIGFGQLEKVMVAKRVINACARVTNLLEVWWGDLDDFLFLTTRLLRKDMLTVQEDDGEWQWVLLSVRQGRKQEEKFNADSWRNTEAYRAKNVLRDRFHRRLSELHRASACHSSASSIGTERSGTPLTNDSRIFFPVFTCEFFTWK